MTSPRKCTQSPPWATKTLLTHGIIPAFLKAFLALKDIFVCFVYFSACLLPDIFVDGPTTSSATRQFACVILFAPVHASLAFLCWHSVDTVFLPTISPAALRLPLNNCHRKLQNDSWRQRDAWREQGFLILSGSSSKCNNDKANSHLQLFLLEQQDKQSIYNEGAT